MTHPTRSRLALSGIVLTGAFLLGTADVHAQVPTFTKSFANLETGELSIWGRHFVLTPEPTVFIGTEASGLVSLPVLSATENLIVASLDSQTAPGTYALMVVFTFSAGAKALSFTVTVGTAGPPGPPGPPGSSGIASLGALSGTACQVGAEAGTLAVAVATDGAVSLRCDVPPPPPPPPTEDPQPITPDAQTITALLTFFSRPRTVSAAPAVFGNEAFMDLTAGPPSGSTIAVSLTPLPQVTSGAPTVIPSRIRLGTEVDTSVPLRMTGTLFGVTIGQCVATHAGRLRLQLEMDFTATSTMTRADVVTILDAEEISPLVGDCGLFGDMVNLIDELRDYLVSTIVPAFAQPICRPAGSVEFGICPGQ